MEVTSRQEAKAAGLKRYFTGKPCKRGHIAERTVSSCLCLECIRLDSIVRRANNPDQKKAQNRAYLAANPERERLRKAAWYEANSAHKKAKSKKWATDNKDKRNAITSARRARELQAMPSWLTEEHHQQMLEIYTEARDREDGPWHVDHIVPLKGRNVRGLHVPWNLRIIPAKDNLSKGNRMPDALTEGACDGQRSRNKCIAKSLHRVTE